MLYKDKKLTQGLTLAKSYGRFESVLFARFQNRARQKTFHNGRKIFLILFFAARKILNLFSVENRPQLQAAR